MFITYLQTTIIAALNLINCWKSFSCFNFCWAQSQCNFRVSALLILIKMQKVTELNSILFCFVLISNFSNDLSHYQYFFYHWFNCNVIRLSKIFICFLIYLYLPNIKYQHLRKNQLLLITFTTIRLLYLHMRSWGCFLSFVHWCRLTLYRIDRQ